MSPTHRVDGPAAALRSGTGRLWWGAAAGTALLVAGTAVLAPVREELALPTVVLLYLVPVLATAALGGVWPAVGAAIAADLLVNWFFVPPYRTLAVDTRDNVVSLIVYLLVATAAGLAVDIAAARARQAQRLAAEAARAGELADIDRLRSALLGAVGHDLRTPLAGIKAAVSSLRQPDVEFSADDRAELLATVEESADRLATVVDNVLAVSRLQAGVLSVDLAPVAVDAVAAQAALATDTRGIDVELDVPDDLPLALADSGLLERVLANLLANACAAARGGAVTIRGRFEPAPAAPPGRSARTDPSPRAGIGRAGGSAAGTGGASSTSVGGGASSTSVGGGGVGGSAGAGAGGAGTASVSGADASGVSVDGAGVGASAGAGALGAGAAGVSGARAAGSGDSSAVRPGVGGRVLVAVVDHGPGMPAELREAAFAPFQRLDDHTGGGLGLGLAIARGFTEAQGGTLTPTETPGGGLTMTVRLPVADRSPAAADHPAPAADRPANAADDAAAAHRLADTADRPANAADDAAAAHRLAATADRPANAADGAAAGVTPDAAGANLPAGGDER